MIRKPLLDVNYSYEHGDKSLPPLKDLVSDIEDPEKAKIIAYLNMNMIYTRMTPRGDMEDDEITPGEKIGVGHGYSDGVYVWNDIFTNYVKKYNIPVPKEFRDHILKNYKEKHKRHTLLRLMDEIEICNNPRPGYNYKIRINRNGVTFYENSYDCLDGAVMYIRPHDAEGIVRGSMVEVFCNDTDGHGKPFIDAYHWKIFFYRKGELIDTKEGWPGEDKWRHDKIKAILEYIERQVQRDIGTEYMKIED